MTAVMACISSGQTGIFFSMVGSHVIMHMRQWFIGVG